MHDRAQRQRVLHFNPVRVVPHSLLTHHPNLRPQGGQHVGTGPGSEEPRDIYTQRALQTCVYLFCMVALGLCYSAQGNVVRL